MLHGNRTADHDCDVIVTGARGFIGGHMVRALAQSGARVHGIGHGSVANPKRTDWNSEDHGLHNWLDADVTSDALFDLCDKPTAIYHCAGSGSVHASFEAPASDFQRSLGSLLNVLEAVRLRWPECCVVFPSSAAVYGARNAEPIPETADIAPISPYGAHKAMAESLLQSYGTHFGVASVAVRLFSVYGPGLRKQLLWDACQKLEAGQGRFKGTGEESRDWLHVRDTASLLMAARAQASVKAPVFNGGTGVATCIRDVVAKVAKAMPKTSEPVFSGGTRQGDPSHFRADMELAHQMLDWQARHDLTDGITEYVAWYREASQ